MKSFLKEFSVYFVGLAAGIINGLLGGGGGMIVVPGLALTLGLTAKKSHATALAVILPASVVSACVLLFTFKNDWVLLSATTLGVSAGGVVGALLLKKLKNPVITKIFAVLMLLAGVKLLFFK